jgi:2'-5' RNA ligase
MPEDETRERLTTLVQRLAARLGTVAFAPHVTLLAGLTEPEDEVLWAAARLSADLLPLQIALDGVEDRDEPFRCLFVRATATHALLEAHAAAARLFGRAPDPAFLPHLSLVYGWLAPGVKSALAREIEAEARCSIAASRLHVWRTSGLVTDWQRVGTFDLAGRALPYIPTERD